MRELNTEKRFKICESCPIFIPDKAICNPKLWLNPKTNEVSTCAKSGYIRGCGCHLKIKVKNISNHCIAGKW